MWIVVRVAGVGQHRERLDRVLARAVHEAVRTRFLGLVLDVQDDLRAMGRALTEGVAEIRPCSVVLGLERELEPVAERTAGNTIDPDRRRVPTPAACCQRRTTLRFDSSLKAW
jgi:hypothetical protein